ncbi:MAG: hypothetical protein FJ125_11845 [Deltaproteobacteria bacterium]|nr:hypothetical protein [Deltaproteobacteria bacterium]
MHRGVGTWTYHMTVARELDPIAHDSIGDVSVAYDIGDARNLEVSFAGVQGPHDPVVIDALYRYTEAEDGSGTFDFISNLDVDREENPARDRRELVQVRSRWLARGDGRSDVLASHGDLPQGMKADVIECWDNAFVRTYVSYAVAADRSEEGDAASWPYADRQLPTFAGFDPDAFADGDLVAAVPVPDDFAAGLAPIEEPVAEPASLYLLTRTMIEGVNAQVKNVLAMLEEGLEHPPSDCEPDRCTWGPWTDFATGVTARLVVTRLGEGRFGFASEVKLFGGAEDSWAALFRGEMTESDAGAAGEDDGEGWFVFDLDVLHALNPEEMLGGSFRAELLRQGGQLRIAVRFDQVVSAERPEPADVRYLLQVQPDGAGSLDLQFSGDIDEGNPARPGVELVQMHSRWVAGGAGMASARVTGGDIEPGQEWLSVQCWDEHAAPTHERMMPQAAGGEGRPPIDAQQCIHDDWVDPSFPPMADEQE